MIDFFICWWEFGYSLCKISVENFYLFLNLGIYLSISISRSLYIVDMRILFVHVDVSSVAGLFIFLKVAFDKQKVLILIISHLSIFPFMACDFCIILKKNMYLFLDLLTGQQQQQKNTRTGWNEDHYVKQNKPDLEG